MSVSDTFKTNKKRCYFHESFLFLEGSTRTAQVLLSLLYKAAECGAQVFIEMIFNSSVGKVIFHEYKNSVPLPEVIARNHGHENTALYLEEITARLVAHTTVLFFHSTLLPPFLRWNKLIEVHLPMASNEDFLVTLRYDFRRGEKCCIAALETTGKFFNRKFVSPRNVSPSIFCFLTMRTPKPYPRLHAVSKVKVNT